MNTDVLFSIKDKEILEQARKTYGAHKQVGVAAEECTELAKELIKAFRYDDFRDAVWYTKNNVVDEVADVLIVLDHVMNLYGIKERDLIPHIHRKIERLNYWLDNSDSIEFTTQHRTIKEREDVPYDAFGDYSGICQASNLVEKKKGIYENESIRVFETGDKQYREE